jgi:hypothetical protein
MAKTFDQGCPRPLGFTSSLYVPQMPDMEIQDLMFSLLDFSLALTGSFLFIPPFFPFL